MKKILITLCFILISMSPVMAAPYDYPVSAVFIDAGHGGHDSGARGDGVMEKDIVLDYAFTLRDILERKAPDLEIIMIREDDTYVELPDRCLEASSHVLEPKTSAVFVSLHANSASTENARGFEIFIKDDRKYLNILKNVPSGNLSGYLRYSNAQLNTLLNQQNRILAQKLLDGISDTFPDMNIRGIKRGDFYVVNATFMPSVLIEIGFINNPEDREMMMDDHFRRKFCASIADSIVSMT